MVWNLLRSKNLFICDCFLHSCSVYQSVLGSVTLCNYRHNSKDVTIGMNSSTFLGFQTDGIVDWLVADHCICRYVNEADWLRGGNDCCDILIDGKLLHFQIRLLCHGWEGG